jgi:hypothetical protein
MTLRKRSLPEEVRSMEGVGDTLTAARNTMQTKAHSCVPQRAQRVSDGETAETKVHRLIASWAAEDAVHHGRAEGKPEARL